MTDWTARADLVVVGTGVAGLTAALEASALGLQVLVVTKADVEDGNTRWAQGGLAVALPGNGGTQAEDTVEAHVADTLAAGGGLAEETAVRTILADGGAAVAGLQRRGACFDTTAGFDGRVEAGAVGLARTREGGHTARRVIHAGGDATGTEIERALGAAAIDRGLPVLARHCALEVLPDATGAVAGLAVLDEDGRIGLLAAPAVLLATGGFGQLYTATTNPDVATGDGLALALRAGAVAADLEFVQFHPTVLYTAGARGRRPLVTEAVRGEGGVLLDATGARVMAGVHPLADLAPRDAVAAAITRVMAGTGTEHVLLDATSIPGFAERFPTVHAACAAAGIDPAAQPIPVAPAAHYACGGVLTDVDGRSSVPGLYAAGEVARTGLHGANRLASNSLLEGLVMGTRAARAVAGDGHRAGPPVPPAAAAPRVADRDLLQLAMTRHAGIGRDTAGLASADAALEACMRTRPLRTPADVADSALTLVARAVLAAAAQRTESRGCHVRTDHPDADPRLRRSITVVLDARGEPAVVAPEAVGDAA